MSLSWYRRVGERKGVWFGIIALSGSVFLLDVFLPLGVAIGMLYAGVVFFAAKYAEEKDVLLAAIGCTALVCLGAVSSTRMNGVPAWMWGINRVMSLVVIWLPVPFLARHHRATEALRTANAELESRVAARTSELERHREDLRCLTGRLIMAHEEERQRLARDLHDDFCQRLGMVLLDLAMYERRRRRES